MVQVEFFYTCFAVSARQGMIFLVLFFSFKQPGHGPCLLHSEIATFALLCVCLLVWLGNLLDSFSPYWIDRAIIVLWMKRCCDRLFCVQNLILWRGLSHNFPSIAARRVNSVWRQCQRTSSRVPPSPPALPLIGSPRPHNAQICALDLAHALSACKHLGAAGALRLASAPSPYYG